MTCTSEHPFYVAGRGFVEAQDLGIGTQIVTRAGPRLFVTDVRREISARGYTVYNLVVPGDHTYFAGEADGGVWVHNPGACPFTPDQEALVDLARRAKRTGVDEQDARTLVDWAREYGLPAWEPEQHGMRGFGSLLHIRIGPVDHIRVLP